MSYSIDDLKWTSVLEFRCVGTGKYYFTSNGKKKEITVGKNFVHTTAAGVMELDEWRRLMEDAVEREGKRELLNRVVEYCRIHCAWLRRENEIRGYALECLSSEAYRVWSDFKEVG